MSDDYDPSVQKMRNDGTSEVRNLFVDDLDATKYSESLSPIFTERGDYYSVEQIEVAFNAGRDSVYSKMDFMVHVDSEFVTRLQDEVKSLRLQVLGMPKDDDHAMSCSGTAWNEQGPMGPSGDPCNCYISRLGGPR